TYLIRFNGIGNAGPFNPYGAHGIRGANHSQLQSTGMEMRVIKRAGIESTRQLARRLNRHIPIAIKLNRQIVGYSHSYTTGFQLLHRPGIRNRLWQVSTVHFKYQRPAIRIQNRAFLPMGRIYVEESPYTSTYRPTTPRRAATLTFPLAQT